MKPLKLTVNMLEGAGSGDLLPNLNRWEGQLGLAPTPAAEAPAKARALDVDGHTGQRVDLTGTDPKANAPARLLAFILPHGRQAWSFKLLGPPDKVAAQEAAFDAFVASVRFTSHDHGDEGTPTTAAAAAPGAAPAGPADNKAYALKKFATPPGWVQDPAERTMREMTFNVAGAGGADNERAELIVTKFARDRFGTILDNVNRWRREVGLPPTQDETQENFREVRTAAGARAVVFDFAPAGDPAAAPGARRSFVAMLPQGGEMWFVKLIGPPKTVADQRASYDAFLQSLEFGEAGE